MPVIKKLCPFFILVVAVLACLAATKSTVPSKGPQERTYGDAYVAVVSSVSDGSTFTVTIRDYPPIIGERIPVRISGIDTPDLKDPRPEIRRLAQRSRQVTASELRTAKIIKLRNMRRDKSFRIIADVELDGHSLARTLIEGGYAKPSFGEGKIRWEPVVQKP